MKKCIYILFLLLISFTTTKAQFIFDRALGTDGNENARDFFITSDGNYMVMGYSQGGSPGNDGLYFAKLDTSGTLLWEKWHAFLNSSLPNYATWQSSVFCEAIDSGIVVGSKIDTGNVQMGLLLKFNSQGDTLFYKSDSVSLGNNVAKVLQAPDGNLLALVNNQTGLSLVKLDNNFNFIAGIDSITGYKGIEVINNKIYLLKQDSINNLYIIDNNMLQIDTLSLPLELPAYIRKSYNNTHLLIEGTDTSSNNKKLLTLDLLGNVSSSCDSIYNPYRDDFATVTPNNDLLYLSRHWDTQWGQDVKLYFVNNCGKLLHDTILYRWSMSIQPLNEYGVRVLADNEGNYLLFGGAEYGVLGNQDIFLVKYKKWDFPTATDTVEEDSTTVDADITLYPNPSEHYLNIKCKQSALSYFITDITGKKVLTGNINALTKIDVSRLKGMYFITVKGNKLKETHKIVLQ